MRDKKFLQIITEETLATDENEKQLIFENIKRSISARETPTKKRRFVFSRYGLAAVSLLIISIIGFVFPTVVDSKYTDDTTPAMVTPEPEEIYYSTDMLDALNFDYFSDLNIVYPANLSLNGFYADYIHLFVSKEKAPVNVYFTIQYKRTENTDPDNGLFFLFENDTILLTVYLVEKYIYGREVVFEEKLLPHPMEINIGETTKTISYSDTISESGTNNTKTKFKSGKLTYYIEASYFESNIDTFDTYEQGEFLNNILTQLF